jgi:hypothetical protein
MLALKVSLDYLAFRSFNYEWSLTIPKGQFQSVRQTTQCPKEKEQRDIQRSTEHYIEN